MQLHVLGPAFGLPSIDAECLATVALLQLYSPPTWSITLADGLTQRLPLLVDGGERREGFKSISAYITKTKHHTSSTPSAVEKDAEEMHRADSIALTSFLQLHAQTLLDISLYVSHENYTATRSAFAKILPWYSNYLVPPRRREEARTRTAHLGISSIDVDDVHEDMSRPSGFDSIGKEKEFEAATKQRASLLLPNKNTVRSLLGRAEHSAVFKLHALADNVFGPLSEMLGDGDKDFFLGTDEPQAVDCLIYAYLALMLYPTLPQPWLAQTMRRRYAKLVRFTERMHERLKMGVVDVEAVLAVGKCTTDEEAERMRKGYRVELPYSASAPISTTHVAKSIANDPASRIPIIGPPTTELISLKSHPQPFWRSPYFPATLAAIATSVGLSVYYTFTVGIFTWPRGEPIHIFGRRKFSDYGDLGAAIAGIGLLSQQVTGVNDDVTFRPQSTSDNPVRVEVEVEKDELP